MTEQFSITLAQLNPIVGDVEGNAGKARDARVQARADGADLMVLPELFIAGYPPEDLVLKPAFQAACRAAVGVALVMAGLFWLFAIAERIGAI